MGADNSNFVNAIVDVVSLVRQEFAEWPLIIPGLHNSVSFLIVAGFVVLLFITCMTTCLCGRYKTLSMKRQMLAEIKKMPIDVLRQHVESNSRITFD